MPSALQRFRSRWSASSDTTIDIAKLMVKPERQPNMRKSKAWPKDVDASTKEEVSRYVAGVRQTIVLHGESIDVMFRLAEKLRKKLQLSFTKNHTVQDWEDYGTYLHNSVVTMTKVVIPNKELHRPTNDVYELRHLGIEGVTSAENRQAIYHARNTGEPVEIGYVSRRRGKEGNHDYQTHVHRVNVKSADGVGFTAKHGRGLRRYRFDKLQWVRIETGIFSVVLPEPVIEISFEQIAGGYIAHLTVGTTANLYQPIKELANG
jgi:hypothetical protein